MSNIAPPTPTAILRYARGEIPAWKAVDLMGPTATLHDLIEHMRLAGIEPPRPSSDVESSQVEKARLLLK